MYNKSYANGNLVIRKWMIDKVLNKQENKYEKQQWEKPKRTNEEKADINSY